ncbi:MAG TPA: prolyl oligopeptidase family serine peptidase, partial [Acholeplasmataceae bacterium]|nr:prolyl oligopeptidase family serine peptidase [Acholeplasmataceae bacterium]
MYFKENKKTLLTLIILLGVILVSSFFASLIQSRGFSVKVTDLRDVENVGVWEEDSEIEVKGKVVSGILFVPKKASKDNKLPAVVLTHGYLNYRELQLQNATELARRGFVVLTVDREAHGNFGNTGNSSSLTTRGLYDAAKYLYNLEYVDRSRIGISGHSMGGFDTASTLREDILKPEDAPAGRGLGIVSAGLIQAWSSYMGAGPDVSVGILKARDDEFFFQSTLPDGTLTIARQYMQSVGAANFVGIEVADSINVVNGGKYHNGELIDVEFGKKAPAGFRAIYEADEIHPQNHFSTESAGYVVDFFYTAFGTPEGFKTIKASNQTWW